MATRKPTQKQLDALKPTQFKPGQSGNPSGRKPSIFVDVAKDFLMDVMEGDKQKRNRNRLIVEQLFAVALKGGPRALDAIFGLWDRLDGKPVQRTELSGPGGGAMMFDTPTSREDAIRRLAELGVRVVQKPDRKAKEKKPK